MRTPIPGQVRLPGLRIDLQRPTLSQAHPHLGTQVSLRLRGTGSYRAAGTAQDSALPCNVMLSGYPSPLYDELLEEWRSLELLVMNQSGVRTEKLLFNFTPDRVHWASHAGKNSTDRQRIKRKAANWGKRYRRCPVRSAWQYRRP